MLVLVVRRLFVFLVPGGLLLLAGILFNHNPAAAPWQPLVMKLTLGLGSLAGILLGWRFNRSKPVFLILALLLAERGIALLAPARGLVPPAMAPGLFQMVALLLPLNFILLSLGWERGLFSFSGLWRLLALAGQPLLLLALVLWQPGLPVWLRAELLPGVPPLPGRLCQAAQLAFLLAAIYLLIRLALRRGALEAGYCWSLVAAWQGLAFSTGSRLSIALGVAALILAGGIVEAAHTLAFRDELTGLPSRRALNELLLRLSGRYAVAMLDIDFFKKFNDKYGHDVGDEVLKMVASRIGRVRGGGRSFRYGGEEFTVVFPGRTAAEAAGYLEGLRREVETAGFTLRGPSRPPAGRKGRKARGAGKKPQGRRVGVTISIGVAEHGRGRQPAEEVVKKADRALYAAKEGGRNRVVA